MNLIPAAGERLSLFGMSGSGKTSCSLYILRRLIAAPALIYDVKIEPKFLTLPHSVVANSKQEAAELVDAGEHDYIVVRPSIFEMVDPGALDNYLLHHYHAFQGLPAYIDEVGPFHRNYMPGPGLMALLTRGRSKGITTILGSQRPSGISRSCITEVNKTIIYRLQDKLDRKRMDDLIEDFSELAVPKPRSHQFYFMDMNEMEKPVLMGPVPLDVNVNSGYVDNPSETDASAVPDRKSKALWL